MLTVKKRKSDWIIPTPRLTRLKVLDATQKLSDEEIKAYGKE